MCSCAFFQENLLGKGPCEHMIALFRASVDGRKDLPTSTPAAAPPARQQTEEEETDEDAEEEGIDEADEDENNEGR